MSYTALKNTLAESLRTAYQLEEDDIAAILPDNEEEFKSDSFKSRFLDLDKDRVQKINLNQKDKFDQFYNKSKKEVLSSFEKEVKAEFGINDEDLKGLDLVRSIVEQNSKAPKADISKLTEDEIKAHPSVIKILNEKDSIFKQREQEIKSEFDNQMNTFNKKERFNQVSKKALEILESMNPVLSTDPFRASNQKNILLEQLKNYDYQEDNGKFFPLKDGKRLENDHGHGIDFDNLIKNEASKYFDFKKADDRSNPNPSGEGGTTHSLSPKTEAEYVKTMSDQSIPREERQKVREAWQNKQAAS